MCVNVHPATNIPSLYRVSNYLVSDKIITMKRTSIRGNSPLTPVYVLLGVNSPRGLSDGYLEEDQKIVTSRISNYHDKKLITNKVKNILEKIDARTLSKEERCERRLVLWLWYHHAISYAVWGYKDKRRARKYSSRALKYQPENHPNHITRLLYLLVRDRFPEAKRWVKIIKDKQERTTALHLLKFYNEGGFFM
jgi:hypothetical protein